MTKDQYIDYLMSIEIPDDTSKIEESRVIYDILKAGMNITPKSLYRYRVCNDYAFEALENDKFLLTKPTLFNDPFDALLYVNKEKLQNEIKNLCDISKREDVIKKLKEDPEYRENEIKLLGKEFIEYFENKKIYTDEELILNSKIAEIQAIKIINDLTKLSMKSLKQYCLVGCLSEDIFSVLMWAHYADSHKGFALNYDFKSRYMVEAQINGKKVIGSEFTDKKLFPVKYTNERFDATYFVEHNFIYNFYYRIKVKFKDPFYDKLFYYKYLLFKSMDWSYEREWRVIKQTNLELDDKRDFDYIDYIRPKEIFLGAFISDKNKAKLVDIAKQKNIKVYQMLLEDDNISYKMNYKEIKL